MPSCYPMPFAVPADKKDPRIDFPEYKPTPYTAPVVLENAKLGQKDPARWADKEDVTLAEVWGRKTCFSGLSLPLATTKDAWACPATSLPLNPWRRTGFIGRGLLGKYGTNQAADSIVMRRNPSTQELEVVLVRRKDTGQWAIPGGMVDEGEVVWKTLKREFKEEAGSANADSTLDAMFANPEVVYQGYVDDYRNTDNAWIETTAAIVWIPDGSDLTLKADGVEVSNVAWFGRSKLDGGELELFASHNAILVEAFRAVDEDEKDDKMRKRKGDVQAGEQARKRSRDDGCTDQDNDDWTSKPDALYHGLLELGFHDASRERLRSLSMPKFGRDPKASWASVSDALITLGYPLRLCEVTHQLIDECGPMVALLLKPLSGVYLVSMWVIVDGMAHKHCVIFSAIQEGGHAPGERWLIDNHSQKMLEGKGANGSACKSWHGAMRAWDDFIGLSPACEGRFFSVKTAHVYELRPIG